jgi:hypothetical protein
MPITQHIDISAVDGGQNLTMTVRNASGVVVQSVDVASARIVEGVLWPYRYRGTFTDLPAGWYHVELRDDQHPWASTYVYVAAVDGEYSAETSPQLVSADHAAVAAEVDNVLTESHGEGPWSGGAGSGSGDATEAKQDLILSKLQGTPINVVSPISNTGTVTLRLGDDDAGDRWRVNYPVANGADLRTFLQSAAVANAYFVARRSSVNDLVVEIDPDNITAPDDDGTIIISIEIPRTAKPRVTGVLQCSVLAVDTEGRQHHETIGILTLEPQIGKAPTA